MGDCGSPNQVCTFHSSQNQLPTTWVCWVVFLPHSTSTWHAKNHCVWQRASVHCSFLGTFAQDVRHQLSQKFCLSPLDLRANWMCKSNIGRHVESLCHLFKGFMGKVATFSWVLDGLMTCFTLSPNTNYIICMTINLSLYDYTRSMPARLRNFFYSFFSILSFEECQVCVHYLEITICTPAITLVYLQALLFKFIPILDS